MLDIEALGLPSAYLKRLVTVGLVREPAPDPWRRLHSAADVYADFQLLASLDREVFLALYLDQKNRMVGVHLVSMGSIAASLVHPREVFKAAILTNAAYVLVLHNHPSGDPSPSREDREITSRLQQSGELLGIPLLDHVVIGTEGYYSFSGSGVLS